MDAFSFLAKLLGTSARVGAAIAFVAVAVYLGRRAGVNFFVDLNKTLFWTLVIAGLIGAAMVAVEQKNIPFHLANHGIIILEEGYTGGGFG